MIKGACLVGQSGGPTAVINSSLCGVVLTALKNPNITNVFGALNGVDGILSENIIDFKNEDIYELELLKNTPGAILGSNRVHLPELDSETDIYERILNVFKKYDIRFFFYIGGNDSMDTCHKINEYCRKVNYDCNVIGVPKTIDNDLCCTDHTPGYGSACKYIATTLQEIYYDITSYKKGRVTIVEIMGRDAGWLVASSKLATLAGVNIDLIYLPESNFDLEDFLLRVKNIYDQKHFVFVCVGEGIKDKDRNYIQNYQNFNNNDTFGHVQLGGVASFLCSVVEQRYKLPVRAIELNLPQRAAAHLASLTDINEAYKCGETAVNLATNNITGKMVCMNIVDGQTTYNYCNLNEVAGFVKEVPNNFISECDTDITCEYIEYAKNLIMGEPNIKFENGIPRFTKLNKEVIKKVN